MVSAGSLEARGKADLLIRDRIDDFIRDVLNSTKEMGKYEEARYQSIHVDSVVLHRQEFETSVPMEVIIDLRTEYIAIELRAYPLLAHSSSGSGNSFELVRRALTRLQDRPIAESDSESPFLYDDDVSKDGVVPQQNSNPRDRAIGFADKEQKALYTDFWENCVGLSSSDVKSYFGPPAKAETARSEAQSTETQGVAAAQKAQFVVKGIFSGIVLKLDSLNRASSPHPASEQDHNAPKLEIFPKASEKLAAVSSVSLAEGDFDAFATKQFSLNRRYIQYNSLFFKKLLGYWPDNKERSKAHSNTHAGSNVLCGVMDGLGIYGCSYSANPNPTKADTWSEVRFFLIYSGPSRHQLARFTQRLLLCGQTRVFLQPDFVQFRKASLAIRAHSASIDSFSIQPFDESRLIKIREDIEEDSKKVRGGLLYRVARTRYYWSLLNVLVDNLRIVRIAGWQTYNDYIQRIYAPHIAKYEEAGQLLHELELKIARAEESLETRSAERLAKVGQFLATLGAIGLVGSLVSELVSLDVEPGIPNPFNFSANFRKMLSLALTLATSIWFSCTYFRAEIKEWLGYRRKPYEAPPQEEQ